MIADILLRRSRRITRNQVGYMRRILYKVGRKRVYKVNEHVQRLLGEIRVE